MDKKTTKIILLAIIVAVPALIAAIVAIALVLPVAGQIEAGAITSEKIAVAAITTEKLANASVDLNKLSQAVIDAIVAAKEIPIESKEIVDKAITEEKLADNAVSSKKIADATILNEDIASDAAIADSKLAALYLQLGRGLSRGDKVFLGQIDFDESYAKGGETIDLRSVFSNAIKIVIVEPSKNGYLFSVDSNGFSNRTFKVKAMHFDPTAAAAGPAIEVAENANLSTLANVKYIAIGS